VMTAVHPFSMVTGEPYGMVTAGQSRRTSISSLFKCIMMLLGFCGFSGLRDGVVQSVPGQGGALDACWKLAHARQHLELAEIAIGMRFGEHGVHVLEQALDFVDRHALDGLGQLGRAACREGRASSLAAAAV